MRELGDLLDRAEERKWQPKGRVGDVGDEKGKRSRVKRERKGGKEVDACFKADASSPATT
jgi:hypothetical protein